MKKLLLIATLLTACKDDTTNENEVITTIQLAFAPPGGGAPMTFEFDDPDGDGGQAGTAQPITLTNDITYTLNVKFLNRTVTPAEDITVEVMDEGFQHMLFFTGSAVKGPATNNAAAPLTQAYADMDTNGLPIGLADTIMTAAGTGTLTVTLRHMPPEEPPAKSVDSPTQVKNGGFAAIGGSTDATADFLVTVQ